MKVYFTHMFDIFINLIFTIGLTLGVGSSTFALIFYIRAFEDGIMDDSERRFLHSVFVMLRIGMTLIFLGLIGSTVEKLMAPELLTALWVLLGIITMNAILMDKHLMPMKYGPVLAGGSWYSLLLTTKLPIVENGAYISVVYYLIFLVVFYLVFTHLKKKYTIQKQVG